jgi:hypothetical protein
MTSSEAEGRPERKDRAASRRTAADVELMIRIGELLPDAMPETRVP